MIHRSSLSHLSTSTVHSSTSTVTKPIKQSQHVVPNVVLNRAVFLINTVVLVGATFLSPSAVAPALQLVPVVGLMVYVGLISGHIPSPLYDRGDRWPREYAIFQLMLLVLTATRLTRSGDESVEDSEDNEDSEDSEDDEDYDYDIEELATFTSWLGSDLNKLFFKGNLDLFTENFTEEMIYFGTAVTLSYAVTKIEWLHKLDASKHLPMPLVFLRNFGLHVAITVAYIWNDMSDPEQSQYKFCRQEYSVVPGFVAPDYSMSRLTHEFAAGWKVFHLSDLWLVRLSHAILYPSILLLYTRRPLTMFFVWVFFIEIDFFHALADASHYVSGPDLAEARLDFQGGVQSACYLNVQVVQTLMAYPLNFLYLATRYGDTAEVVSSVRELSTNCTS